MSFDAARHLAAATGRAKSDVANKLVSMLLHEVSRKVSAFIGVQVADNAYTRAVRDTFGDACAYCSRALEFDRAAVEHLDGMNRYRVGLHVVGNVVVACKRCNNEKRRDDVRPHLKLADSGWESFLLHDGSRCSAGCKTCEYWRVVWPASDASRKAELSEALTRLRAFRARYSDSTIIAEKARAHLTSVVEKIYRECQIWAATEIARLVHDAIERLEIALPRRTE